MHKDYGLERRRNFIRWNASRVFNRHRIGARNSWRPRASVCQRKNCSARIIHCLVGGGGNGLLFVVGVEVLYRYNARHGAITEPQEAIERAKGLLPRLGDKRHVQRSLQMVGGSLNKARDLIVIIGKPGNDQMLARFIQGHRRLCWRLCADWKQHRLFALVLVRCAFGLVLGLAFGLGLQHSAFDQMSNIGFRCIALITGHVELVALMLTDNFVLHGVSPSVQETGGVNRPSI
nr:MAG TPA: hypothetical protein [Caudoviricetes sp.]